MSMLDCKQASRLMSEGMDRELDLTQRATLRLHLLICAACSKITVQLGFLRSMSAQYPGPDDEEQSTKTRGK